jgi:hypothetical protein
MSEASFWNYLRKLLPKEGHYTRIEAHDTAAGFPDVHYTLEGYSGTIELKDAKRPGDKHPFKGQSGLRRSQIAWMTEECDKGGKVVLALQCGDRVYLVKADLYFDELHRTTEEELTRIADVHWKKGPRNRVDEDVYPLENRIRDWLENL